MRALFLIVTLGIAVLATGCQDGSGLDGFGTSTNTRSEHFTQLQPSQADILWVIDSSCSMEDEQDALVANFPHFIEFFVTRRLSFRIAVTTTNIADPNSEGLDGALRGGDAPWLTEDTEDIEQEFLQLADVGVDHGHGKEKGLEAAYQAISNPRPKDEGFVRDDAQLSIVIVSDEPDHTERANEPDHDEYIDWAEFSGWMDDLKGEELRRMTQLSAIVGISEAGFEDPNGCGGDWNQSGEGALRGDGYLEAADATGGTWVSICEPDWGDMMGRVGLAAAGLMDAWTLEEEPVPDTVKVELDGRAVFGWVYREYDNAVHFTRTDSVPQPGQEITVEYRVPDDAS